MPSKPLFNKRIQDMQLKPWTPKRIAKWERIRARGRTRYLIQCVAVSYVIAPLVAAFGWILTSGIVHLWVAALLVGPLFGLRYGLAVWRSNERLYELAIQRKNSDGANLA